MTAVKLMKTLVPLQVRENEGAGLEHLVGS